MGCDIHIFPEYSYGTDPWMPHPAGEPFIPRDYALFARLGYVPRPHVTEAPMYPLLGAPDDMSEYYATYLAHNDLHSWSWLTFGQAMKAASKDGRLVDRTSLDLWLSYARSLVNSPNVRQRIVFAFDN